MSRDALIGSFSIFWIILLLVLAILGLLMPVFVYQIRNSAQDMDKKMNTIIQLLSKHAGVSVRSKIKTCPFCGAKNRTMDVICIRCGKAMGI